MGELRAASSAAGGRGKGEMGGERRVRAAQSQIPVELPDLASPESSGTS